MNAAWLWIKALSLAALLITLGVQRLQLNLSQTEQATLSEKLRQAQADNQSHLTTIASLKEEASAHNERMVKRQQERNRSEGKLRETITQLKTQMDGIECHIPDGVTERLREPY